MENGDYCTMSKVVNGTTITRTYCKNPDETETAFGLRCITQFEEFCDGVGG